jgi:DNA-binding transcriptional ArsR family regulator
MNRDTSASAATAMVKGRQADSARRRERVLKALADAVHTGDEISVSGIAARAGVDRTFLYRHRDLLAHVHAAETQPSTADAGTIVSRASLKADLLAAQQRCVRLSARTQQLETRLSEILGEQAWRSSGLGAPTASDQLQRQVVNLEQQVVDLRLQLEERDGDLAAARGANRELMTRINGVRHAG